MKSEFGEAAFSRMENRNGVIKITFSFAKILAKAITISYPFGCNPCDRYEQSEVNLLSLDERNMLVRHEQIQLKEAEFKNLMNLVAREVN